MQALHSDLNKVIEDRDRLLENVPRLSAQVDAMKDTLRLASEEQAAVKMSIDQLLEDMKQHWQKNAKAADSGTNGWKEAIEKLKEIKDMISNISIETLKAEKPSSSAQGAQDSSKPDPRSDPKIENSLSQTHPQVKNDESVEINTSVHNAAETESVKEFARNAQESSDSKLHRSQPGATWGSDPKLGSKPPKTSQLASRLDDKQSNLPVQAEPATSKVEVSAVPQNVVLK